MTGIRIARTLLAAVSLLGAAACTFLRSLDGFSDVTGDEVPTTDAEDPEADGALVLVEAGSDASDTDVQLTGDVTCKVEKIAEYRTAVRATESGYLSGVAVTQDALFLATGNWSESTELDGGAVVRVEKAFPHQVSTLRSGIRRVRACDGWPEGAACISHGQLLVFQSDGGLAREIGMGAIVNDIKIAPSGTMMTTRPVDANPRVWRLKQDGDAEALTVREASAGISRVLADESHVFSAHDPPGGSAVPGLVRHDVSAWDDPGAQPPGGCTLVDEREPIVYHVAMNDRDVFWLNADTHHLKSTSKSCNGTLRTLIGYFYGLAASDRFVFVRTPARAQLYPADDLRNGASVCDVAIDEWSDPAQPEDRSNRPAVFDYDGRAVYFLVSPHVLKLTIEERQ